MRSWNKISRGCLLGLLILLSFTFAVSGADLVGTDSNLLYPTGMTIDANEKVYLVDSGNNNVVMVEDGAVTVVAGYTLPVDRYGIPAGGYLDGDVENCLFNGPSDVEIWNGGLVVSDTNNHCLRFIQDGMVTTLSGTNTAGDKDGTATGARLYLPTGLAVDEDGVLYVADTGNGKIRKISTSGGVTTMDDSFVAPYGLAWHDGALYVSDLETSQIFKLENGEKTVVAGTCQPEDDGYVGGYADGATPLFNGPKGIFVDDSGIYVADSGNGALRLIADGVASTLFAAGDYGETWPAMPSDVLVHEKTVYVCDPFSGNLVALAQAGYLDIPADSWWTAGAYTMVDMGVMTGTDRQTFSPNLEITREMAATILYRLAGAEAVTATVDFADVAEDAWYYDAIGWAKESGVMEGYDDGTFGVGQSITRQDFVTILYRYGQELETTVDFSAYQDGAAVADYAQEAMCWAVGNGILQGMDADTLAPTAYSTRAQASVMLMRWLEIGSS